MAVFTDVDEQDLTKFWEDYPLGEVVSFKGIAEGVENSNFFVETYDARFILTLFEKRVHEEDLPYFVGLMDQVSSSGFACPKPIATKEGNTIRTLAGRPALVTSFLQGLSRKRPSVEDCYEVGKALSIFHKAGQPYAESRPNNLSVHNWQDMYRKDRDAFSAHNSTWCPLIDDALATLSVHWPSDLPKGHIHADLFPDNVFFFHDQVSGFIDFYFACEDFLAYDLAICINAWCFETDGSLNVTKSSALINGYESQRPLHDEEKHALPILALGSALRFFLTRAHDYIYHDPSWLVMPKDPSEYVSRMRTHLRAHSLIDYGIWVA